MCLDIELFSFSFNINFIDVFNYVDKDIHTHVCTVVVKNEWKII